MRKQTEEKQQDYIWTQNNKNRKVRGPIRTELGKDETILDDYSQIINVTPEPKRLRVILSIFLIILLGKQLRSEKTADSVS